MGRPFATRGGLWPLLGFTVIEVLIVLAIVGLLSAMATPVWKRLMWRSQTYGAADEFRNAILLARSDAISHRHHSGFLLDPANLRYLRFVDSTGADVHNGRYTAGEKILQNWQSLPSHLVFFSTSSSISPDPPPRNCNSMAVVSSSTVQSGTFSLVFMPDGRSWATFQAKFGISSFTSDTFQVDVLPPTGLVTMLKK